MNYSEEKVKQKNLQDKILVGEQDGLVFSKEIYFKNGKLTSAGAKKFGFQKGNKFGFKKGNVPWNKGKKFLARKLKGKTYQEIYGKEKAKKIKEKIKDSNAHYWKGKKFSEEHKRKLKENHADFRGNKSPNWKSGYSRNKSEEKKWREKVFKRDNYTCQKCGAKNGQGISIYLNAHHIKGWAKNSELRFEINNGITLCKKCHKKLHHKKKIK